VDAELRIFAPFRLDPGNEQLWRGSQEVRLRRKTFAVLRHLVERPGQLVTKAALLDAVWPDVSVSDSMPAISVRELRKALGDAAEKPRFIETVQGRGYRFIADVKIQSSHASAPPAARQSSFATPALRTLFVGREEERSEVRDALADATSGRGRICLISGEAGIGKSRLCAEIALEAEKNGVAVLVGHCSEQEAVPYLPFVEILENWVDRRESPDDLRRAMGEDGPELARLLPKLRRSIPDLAAPLELTGEQARRQLFNSFSNFIARRSRERPTLMVLEDLHWADDSSLALITHLSQRHSDLPLLIIGTYRESEIDLSPSLSRTLEGLIRGRLATQSRLEGLPSRGVAQMLQGLSGQAPPAGVVSEILGETGGNPFFVEELFQHLTEENRLYDDAGLFHPELKIGELEVPSNVRLVVGRRLGRLGEATRKILAVAAVIGRSFTFELLEAATGEKADELLDRLDEAHKIGLVRSTTQYPEARFEFSHELIRQTILTHLSVARLRRLHLE
jgi:predicted ATPase/DNA-binding winged helix-turn-helix (wHTH) protein